MSGRSVCLRAEEKLEWAAEDEEPARAETVTEAEEWARELRAGRIACARAGVGAGGGERAGPCASSDNDGGGGACAGAATPARGDQDRERPARRWENAHTAPRAPSFSLNGHLERGIPVPTAVPSPRPWELARRSRACRGPVCWATASRTPLPTPASARAPGLRWPYRALRVPRRPRPGRPRAPERPRCVRRRARPSARGDGEHLVAVLLCESVAARPRRDDAWQRCATRGTLLT